MVKSNSVKIAKLSKVKQEELKNNIEKHFNLTKFQTYFPSMIYWEDFDNNPYSKQLFILDSKYQLTGLERKSDKSESELDFLGYINKKNNSNNNSSSTKHEIHFKINPLLEPSNVMMNRYQLESPDLMPSVFDYITNKKINSPHNFSYVETLFVYLSSSLVEKGKCPSFPYFYGSYLGVMDTFKQNISDEYSTMKNNSWFNEYKNVLFNIEKVSIEDELFKNLDNLEPINEEEQKNKDTSLGIEDFDFDSIDINNNKNKKKKRCSSFNRNECGSISNNEDDDDSVWETEEEIEGDSEEDKDAEEDVDNEDEDEEEEEDAVDEEEDEDEDAEEDEDEDKDEDAEEEEEDEDAEEDGELNFESDDELDDSYYYAHFKDFPVQLIAMEKMKMTLSDLLKENKITDQEWLAILFQVIFGLAVAQKHFQFTHNDLHADNIMLKPTKVAYLYFSVKGAFYRIPTFGKITKIIDFARAVFKVDGYQFFSDVFKKYGDADGQYTYPYNSSTKIKYAPNPSFDLSYLGITISEYFKSSSPIKELIERWTTDRYGNDLLSHEVNFDLYIKIAHNVNSAVPHKQFNDQLFNQFIIKKDKIPKGEYIYYY